MSVHKPSILHCIELKVINLHYLKYGIKNVRFAALKVYAIGSEVSSVLP
jgi:hypothetical protein